VLQTSLETSVPGLFMTGVVAERTLGPTLRFVTGTNNAGPRLAAALAGKRKSRLNNLRERTRSMNLNPRRSEPRNIKPGAIVLGGNFVGLGVARSLGAHGIPVWVVDADRSKSIAHSPATQTLFRVQRKSGGISSPRRAPPRPPGLGSFSHTDESVEMVSANHESLSSIYHLAAPRAEITQFALDKRLTYGRAAELGIATPWTATGNHPSDVEDRNPPYPLILKPP